MKLVVKCRTLATKEECSSEKPTNCAGNWLPGDGTQSVQRAVARVEPGVIENKSAQRAVARVEPGVREITMIDFCEGEKHQQQSVKCCREREIYGSRRRCDPILLLLLFVGPRLLLTMRTVFVKFSPSTTPGSFIIPNFSITSQ